MFLYIILSIFAFLAGACMAAVILNNRLAEARARGAAAETEVGVAKAATAQAQAQLGEREAQLQTMRAELGSVSTEAARLGEELRQKEVNFAQQSALKEAAFAQRLEQSEAALNKQIELKEANFARQLALQQQQAEEKLRLLNDARVELSNQFKALSAEILEAQSRKFAEQNQTNLAQVLGPLGERIKVFQQKVEEVYVQEGKDRSALGEQVKMLMNLNQQLSADTSNLTRALTTQSKAQGDLGEMILEKILEASGLRKDEEYVVQSSFRNQDGGQSRPDVIVHMPEEKHLIIDSKVSLTAYNEYVNAETEESRKQALARHMDSVRKHVKELAGKDYASLHQLRSIDFVCMFVPIEGAFLAAVSGDAELGTTASNQGVLLMSPSTLLFVVRTVAYLWRQERQKQNVAEIVKKGAELYDKFCGFVEDLQKVGKQLNDARSTYDEAMKKFCEGRGNVIRQAEMLKELGVKPKKSLPVELIDASADDLALLSDGSEAK